MFEEQQQLQKHIDLGRELLREGNVDQAHDKFLNWDNAVANWLDKNYSGTGLSAEWSALSFSSLKTSNRINDNREDWKHFSDAVRERLKWLANIASQFAPGHARPLGSITDTPLSRRVFIVHGRSVGPREATARLLEKLDLEPIILHEQPNEGRTVIEKFLEYADVAFAVVLLTGDDRGGLAGQSVDAYESRARQNVILELGFFLGTLGRKRVCALYEPEVSVPSDYSGVLFVRIDDGDAWKYELAKEMKAAGIPIDMNKVG